MKKQVLFIIMVIILLSILFSGCNESNTSLSNDKSKFIGKWEMETENPDIHLNRVYYTFYTNDTVKIVFTHPMGDFPDQEPMIICYNYEIKDGKLCITLPGYEDFYGNNENLGCQTYQLTSNDTQLILEFIDDPGFPITFNKVEE